MDENNMQPDPSINGGLYNQFPGLSPEREEIIARILEAELERRRKAKATKKPAPPPTEN